MDAVPISLSTELYPTPAESEPVGLSFTSTFRTILLSELPGCVVIFTLSKYPSLLRLFLLLFMPVAEKSMPSDSSTSRLMTLSRVLTLPDMFIFSIYTSSPFFISNVISTLFSFGSVFVIGLMSTFA